MGANTAPGSDLDLSCFADVKHAYTSHITKVKGTVEKA